MKDMDQYVGETYIDICQPEILADTLATFPDPDMPIIIPYTGVDHPKMDMEMNYLEKKSIDGAIFQKLRDKDVCETVMQNIYSLILVQTNKQLQGKAALDATLQAVKTVRNPIEYLMIPNELWFSNQSEQHPIISLCLEMKQMYSTVKYASKNTANCLVRLNNYHKVNEACNGILITRGYQYHGMQILFPLHNTGFESL